MPIAADLFAAIETSTAPEWALVVVGIITFAIIGWQSWETRKSAKAAQVSADAALKNAAAIINAERPWVFVEPVKPTQRTDYWNTRIEMFANNKGRTPAEVIAANCVESWLPYGHTFVDEPRYEVDGLPLPKYLVPGGEPLLVHYLDTSAIPSHERDEATRRDLRRYIVGRVVYRDVLSGEQHETRLCFFLSTVPGFGLVRTGPRSYNLHT